MLKKSLQFRVCIGPAIGKSNSIIILFKQMRKRQSKIFPFLIVVVLEVILKI